MKILITESQLEVIISHIKETNKPKDRVLEEGWKEVVLGTAMLMGFGLSGINAQTAKNALDNREVIKKIESTLESPEIDKLADTLEKIGLKDALNKMQTNAEKIKNNLEVAAKKKGISSNLQVYTTDKEYQIKSKLKQGYALSDIIIEKDTIWKEIPSPALIDSIVDMNFDGNLFQTADFELNPEVKNEIENMIEGVKLLNADIEITKVYGTTDKEPIKKNGVLWNLGIKTNQQLAELRANSLVKYFESNGLSVINIETKPELGGDVYSTTMTDRDDQRENTKIYRGAGFEAKIINRPPADAEDMKVYDVIEKISYELVGEKTSSGKQHKTKFGTKGFKCKIKSGKFNTTACPKF
jgi:flagellar motor protein MotB